MNTQNTDLLKSIQAAVAASPELQTQLAAVTTTDQAAGILSSALSTTVSTADLNALSESAKADMTDQQLDAVSAGAGGLGILLSFLGAGIGCAVLSAAEEIRIKGMCKFVMTEQTFKNH